MFKKKDALFICLIIFSFLGILLTVHTKYRALTYKYNREVTLFSQLTKSNRVLKIKCSTLSSPKRIIEYANKKLGLKIPKANQVFEIEKD